MILKVVIMNYEKELFLLYVVVFGVCFLFVRCLSFVFYKLLKRLVLGIPFQNELARVWRDQYSEYKCNYLVFQRE